MREINECKAEVFRRSENRIKERRKRRNQILAFSTPLCLCIVLGVVVLSSPKKSADSSGLADGEVLESAGDVGAIKGEGETTEFSMVEIVKNDLSTPQYAIETDAVGVNYILAMLESPFLAAGEQDNMGAQMGASAEDRNYSMATPDLTVTFSNTIGDEMVYLMYGNGLSNATTNESVTLTEEQQSELMKKIDMVIDGEETSK